MTDGVCGSWDSSACEARAFAVAIFDLAASDNLHSAGHLLDYYRRTQKPGPHDWLGYMVQDWIDMYGEAIGLSEDYLEQRQDEATFSFTLRSVDNPEPHDVNTARPSSVWAARLMTARLARDEQTFMALWAYLDTLDPTGRGWHIMELLRLLGATLRAHEDGDVGALELAYEPRPPGGSLDAER